MHFAMTSDQDFDDRLDALAQGETFAFRADKDDVLAGALTDVIDSTDDDPRWRVDTRTLQSMPASAPTTSVLPLEFGPDLRQVKGYMVPRPGNMVRVMAMAVVAMMALMTLLTAVIAQAIQGLTNQVRGDERFNETVVVAQPVPADEVMDPEAFARLLQAWPDRRQELWLRRFAALRAAGQWDQSCEAFREAALVDRQALPWSAQMDYLEVLLHIEDLERAEAVARELRFDQLDEDDQQRFTVAMTRLALARVQ
jgi:hypothetical protein